MNFKEKITEMVENVDLIPRKKGNIKSGVKVTSSRNTAHNIKWRSKN